LGFCIVEVDTDNNRLRRPKYQIYENLFVGFRDETCERASDIVTSL